MSSFPKGFKSESRMHLPISADPEIPEFFSGKSIFITGGTGFLGKVLLERLLTTCPEVKNIYLLIREKKNLTPEQRLQQLKQNQVFDELRKRDRGQLDKLVTVGGDITVKQFGLTAIARKHLSEVSVVFHAAATVKLQDELKRSIDQNLRSVITILDLCDALPKVDVFVHVSTAYSNAELTVVEEKVYPPPVELHTLVDNIEEYITQEHLGKLIAPKPNTYTFTKAMAEHVLEKHGCNCFPVAIFKPSIVISSLQHPFPGWIENWNGPSGVIAAVSSGLLRVLKCNTAKRADMVPVDIAVDTLIAAAWETAVDRSSEVRVYHCSTMENPTLWGDLLVAINSKTPLYPSRHAIMYPHLRLINDRFAYRFLEVVLQIIPFHTLEYLKRILGLKMGKNFIEVDSYLRAMNKAMEYFSVREWDFRHENTKKLRERLSDKDRATFNLDPKTINWPQMYHDLIRGTKRHVLRESDEDLKSARGRIRVINLLYTSAKVLFTLISFRLVNQWLSIKGILEHIQRIIVLKLSKTIMYPNFLSMSQF